MRIAFFSPEWPHGHNGIIPYVRCISLALHEMGHEIIVLSPRVHGLLGYEQAVQIPPSRPRTLPARMIRKFLATFGLRWDTEVANADSVAKCLSELERVGRVDVFEMEETFGLCGLVADRTEVPVIVRLHGPYFLNGVFETFHGLLDQDRLAGERYGIERAAAITAPSQQVLEATKQYYGIARDAVVIPNPISLAENAPRWSVETCERDTMLFVGRTDSRKGGDLVIRVFAQLLEENPGLRLHFVGPDCGFAGEDPGVAFDAYVSQFGEGVRAGITYHGPLRPSEIMNLRLKCRVTVVFSRYETFGIVCTEALSLGCPLVATRVGGIPEVVIDGVSGLLADVESVEDMASNVTRLLKDDDLCLRLGKAGIASCSEKFSPSAVADSTLRIYQQVARR